MKRISLIILILSLSVACKDVLDKGLEDQIGEDNFWKSDADLRLYVNQFYPSLGNNVSYYSADNNSDNMQPGGPSDVLNGSRSIPGSGGGWSWSNIRDVNIFMKKSSKITEGNKEDIEQYKGEGYFFRAYFYFEKLKRFGAVPIYKKPLNTDSEEDLYAHRDDRQKVADFIIQDLDKAISFLKTKDELPSNRINLASALLLKSRVSLYEGTWEKYHKGTKFGVSGSDGEEYLKIAVESSGELVNNDNYDIYTTNNPDEDYYKLFNREDDSDNKEVILAWESDPEEGITGGSIFRRLNGQVGVNSGITKQLVDSYLCKDGKPIKVSPLYRGDTTLTQVAKNRDPRLNNSIWTPGQVQIAYEPPRVFKNPTITKGGFEFSTTGYMVRKGSLTDPEQNQTGVGYNTNGRIFRYAEALLNYAEAKAELGDIRQADLDKSVNLLRKRVGMPNMTAPVGFNDPNWNFPNLSPLINEIRRERRVELALEGFRYDDLMRWAADELIYGMKLKGARLIEGKSFPDLETGSILVDKNHYIWRYKNSVPNGFEFNKTRDYLYPIPTRELTLNDSLDQNPGW